MLLEKIQADLINALKSGDRLKTDTLRYFIAAVKKYDIDTYLPGSTAKLTDDDVVKILKRQVKTHEESITAFKNGNRQDLVDKESKELEILKFYLPPEMTDEEIRAIVKKSITGAINFGQAMSMAMSKLKGLADGNKVATIVKEELR
jgi:uncharacterized protein